jgi:hypothetical protein
VVVHLNHRLSRILSSDPTVGFVQKRMESIASHYAAKRARVEPNGDKDDRIADVLRSQGWTGPDQSGSTTPPKAKTEAQKAEARRRFEMAKARRKSGVTPRRVSRTFLLLLFCFEAYLERGDFSGKPPPPAGNMASRFLRTAAQSVRSLKASAMGSTASTSSAKPEKRKATAPAPVPAPPSSQLKPKPVVGAPRAPAAVPGFSRPTAASLNRAKSPQSLPPTLSRPFRPSTTSQQQQRRASTSRRKTGTGIPRPVNATAAGSTANKPQQLVPGSRAPSPVKEERPVKPETVASEWVADTQGDDNAEEKENLAPAALQSAGGAAISAIPVATTRSQRIRPKRVIDRRRVLLGEQAIAGRASLPAVGRGAGGKGRGAGVKKTRSSTSEAMRDVGTPRRKSARIVAAAASSRIVEED